MHGLIALFLGVIALAIILLVIGLVASYVLVVALRAIMALIVSMTIVGSSVITVLSVALMIVAIFTTVVLPVAQFTAMCDRKLSHFLFLWLLVLGNLLENVSRFVGRLTPLEEGDHLERVNRYCLVQIGELVLVCLRLRKEDLFTLLLCFRYVHCLTKVATLKVAENCT
jgi:hypothetical protein